MFGFKSKGILALIIVLILCIDVIISSPLRSYQDVLDQEDRKVNTYISLDVIISSPLRSYQDVLDHEDRKVNTYISLDVIISSPLRSYQDVLDQEDRKVNTYIFRCYYIVSSPVLPKCPRTGR